MEDLCIFTRSRKILEDLKNLEDYKQGLDMQDKSKKTYQDLVGNIQDSLNLIISYMILLRRFYKDVRILCTRSCARICSWAKHHFFREFYF